MSRKSFTLLELIIVVVIIGVIAAFAIPSYQRAIDKAKERRATLNLFTMQQAMIIRYAKTGGYITEDWPDIDTINTKLSIHISDPDHDYRCLDAGWTDYECQAYKLPGYGYGMHIHPGTIPHCMSGGPCPSCGASHDPALGCPGF